jgi:hypothetical protein
MSERVPYRLVEGVMPSLSEIYVRQHAATTKSKRISIDTVVKQGGHLLFVGAPGSGKSSLLRKISSEMAHWWLSQENQAPPYGPVVPILVAASQLTEPASFAESLSRATSSYLGVHLDTNLRPNVFLSAPAPGVKWLVMVDGLDQVLDPVQRADILRLLQKRILGVDESVQFLVTTRPLLDRDIFEVVKAGATQYDLSPFERDDIEIFSKRWFSARTPSEAEVLSDRFLTYARRTPLGDVIRLPLLTTMAAVIFESRPTRALPADIVDLYEKFVDILIDERSRRLRSGETFNRILSIHQEHGQALVDWLAKNLRYLLENVAHEWFFDQDRRVSQIAQAWLNKEYKSPIYEQRDWPRILLTYLSESGLLLFTSDDLEWIHLSFAEYLASARLVDTLDLERWIFLSGNFETENLGRLAVVRSVKRGARGLRLLRHLLDNDPHDLAASLIRRGELVSNAKVRVLTWLILLKQRHEFVGFPANDLMALRAREAALRVIRRAAKLRVLPIKTRVHAAIVLLDSDDRRDQRIGDDILVSIVEGNRADRITRVNIAHYLTSGDSLDESLSARLRSSVYRIVAEAPMRDRAYLVTNVYGALSEEDKKRLLQQVLSWPQVTSRELSHIAEALYELGENARANRIILGLLDDVGVSSLERYRITRVLSGHDHQVARHYLQLQILDPSNPSWVRGMAARTFCAYSGEQQRDDLRLIASANIPDPALMSWLVLSFYDVDDVESAEFIMAALLNNENIPLGRIVDALCSEATRRPRNSRRALYHLLECSRMQRGDRKKVSGLLEVMGGMPV